MKCVFCRSCQALWEAVSRKFYEDLREQCNYWDVFEKESDQDRIRRTHALWESDPTEAFREYGTMAEGGSTFSMMSLGWAFETGTGTTCDLAAAICWYSRAVAAGSESALFDLGRVYLAAGDLKEAERVFAIGVAQDQPQAMYGLAKVYMMSESDQPKARALLEQSAAKGNLQAKMCLARLLIHGRFGWRAVPAGLRLAWSGPSDIAPLLSDLEAEVSDDARPNASTARAASSRPVNPATT